MIPVLDGTGAAGKSVLEGAEMAAALKAIVDAIATAAAANQPVSGPLTDTQLGARGLATDAKMEAVRLLIAGTLKVAAVDGSALATAAKQDAALALLAKPGLGDLIAVPAGSANGTAIGVKPAAARGVRLYLPAGTSVTFAVVSAAPGAPPRTFTASASETGPNWDEPLADASNVYVTAIVGAPSYRWL